MFDRDVKRQMSRRLVGLSNETGRLRPAGPPQADLSARHLETVQLLLDAGLVTWQRALSVEVTVKIFAGTWPRPNQSGVIRPRQYTD